MRPVSCHRTLAKGLSLSTLALMMWLAGGPLLIVFTLLLSSITDILLSRDTSKSMLVVTMGLGVLALGAMSLVYLDLWSGLASVAAAILGVVGFGLGVFAMIWPRMEGFRVPSTIFLSAVLVTVLLSLGLPEAHRLAIFGTLFLALSTAFYGYEEFHLGPSDPLLAISNPSIWCVYYIGYLLVALAFV